MKAQLWELHVHPDLAICLILPFNVVCRMPSRRRCKRSLCSKKQNRSFQDIPYSESFADRRLATTKWAKQIFAWFWMRDINPGFPSGSGGGIKEVIGTHIEVQSGHLLGERLLDTAINNGCDVPFLLKKGKLLLGSEPGVLVGESLCLSRCLWQARNACLASATSSSPS